MPLIFSLKTAQMTKEEAENITKEYAIKYADTIDWSRICLFSPVDIICELAESYESELDWDALSFRDLPEDFIKKYCEKLDWQFLSKNYSIVTFSDQFYVDFQGKIWWSEVYHLDVTTKEFREKHMGKTFDEFFKYH